MRYKEELKKLLGEIETSEGGNYNGAEGGEGPISPPKPPKMNPELQALLNRQQHRMENCRELLNVLTAGSPADMNNKIVERKQQELEQSYEKVNELHEEILARFKGQVATEGYIKGNHFGKLRTTVRQAVDELTKIKGELMSASAQTKMLPQIKIPVFQGDYTKWNTFKDIFNTMVHSNQALNGVQKMEYLKTHIAGDAFALIQHLTLNQVNFEVAWKILNNRRVVYSYLEKMLKYEKMTPRQMVDITRENIEGLKLVGATSIETLIIYLMERKMDQETREKFEDCMENPRNQEPEH